MVFVLGHKNPDTDSICSAIAYARLKQDLGMVEAVAGRVGSMKKETEFVLDFFTAEPPIMVHDVRTRAVDILDGKKIAVTPDTSIKEVVDLMDREQVKTLGIWDNYGRFLGLLTLGDILTFQLSFSRTNHFNGKLKVNNIVRALNGQVIKHGSRDVIYNPRFTVGPGSLFKDHACQEQAIVVSGEQETGSQESPDTLAPWAVILCGEKPDSRLETWVEQDITLISVPNDTFQTANLMGLCFPVKEIYRKERLVSFAVDDLAVEMKKVMSQTRYRSYPVIDEDNIFHGMVSRFNLLHKKGKKVILVDHNEKSQAVDGIEEAEILEIIDHHRLGNIQTGEAVYFRNEPLGSTATIIASIYREHRQTPDRATAGLLCAAILSDTVLFKSPTCTGKDKLTAQELASIAGIDLHEFGRKMFAAGSAVKDASVDEIFFQDFKEFIMGDQKIGISQIETVDIQQLSPLKPQLLELMAQLHQERNYNYLLCMLTDVIDEATTLLIVGENVAKIRQVFGYEGTDCELYLPHVLSRKKQIVPPLNRLFSGL